MSQIVYSNCSTLSASGCFLYTNSALTTPVLDGKYSNGTNCYTVSGGEGQITAVEACTTPTPTPTPTSTPTPSNYSYTATFCGGSQTTVITSVPLSVGSVYKTAPDGVTSACYSIDSFDMFTSDPVTHTFYNIATDCFDGDCLQL
jgi:hypothetical protein